MGRLAAIHLSEYYSRVTLVGNSSNPQAMNTLGEIAGEIYAQAILQMQRSRSMGLAQYLRTHLVDPFSRVGLASFRLPHYHGKAGVIYVAYFFLIGGIVLAIRRSDPLRPKFRKPSSVCFATILLMAGRVRICGASLLGTATQTCADFWLGNLSRRCPAICPRDAYQAAWKVEQ